MDREHVSPGAEETTVEGIVATEGELAFTVDFGAGARQVCFRTFPGFVPGTDGVLPAVLLPAMTRDQPLRISEPIDPDLLGAARDIQAIFQAWSDAWPYAQPPREIEIRADRAEGGPPPGSRGVAAFFSAGVDSFSTVLDHPEITHLVFVLGLDLEPGDEPLQRLVTDRVARAAAELGKEFVLVETNVRSVAEPYVPWEGLFGSLLASTARLLEPLVSRVYIASESPFRALHRRGSHPLIDHLWSGAGIKIIHDGARFNRAEKTVRIATNEVARRSLRVCWENRDSAYNCGRCEKCLRTMVALEAIGSLSQFTVFAGDLDLEAVAATVPRTPMERDFWEENLVLCRERRANSELERAVRRCLENARKAVPTRLEQANQRIEELEAELERSRELIAAIEGSASWRLTAPLRAAKAAVRGGRRGASVR